MRILRLPERERQEVLRSARAPQLISPSDIPVVVLPRALAEGFKPITNLIGLSFGHSAAAGAAVSASIAAARPYLIHLDMKTSPFPFFGGTGRELRPNPMVFSPAHSRDGGPV